MNNERLKERLKDALESAIKELSGDSVMGQAWDIHWAAYHIGKAAALWVGSGGDNEQAHMEVNDLIHAAHLKLDPVKGIDIEGAIGDLDSALAYYI